MDAMRIADWGNGIGERLLLVVDLSGYTLPSVCLDQMYF